MNSVYILQISIRYLHSTAIIVVDVKMSNTNNDGTKLKCKKIILNE